MTSATAETNLLGLGAQRLAWPDGQLEAGVVWVDTDLGTIADVVRPGHGPAGTRPEDVPGRFVDLGDQTVAPGFVDVHVHGGHGFQVNGDSPTQVEEALGHIGRFHVRHGTTALLATTVSDSPERLAATVAGIARAVRAPAAGSARVLGCHLEGPFISPVRAGAQDPAWIRPPDRAELSRLFEASRGTIRIVTVAPELDGAVGLITACAAAGATVSLGHTDADFETARAAFAAGASHVTHLFDAMAPCHHRRPGLIAAALLDHDATIELICDLHHVHPGAIALVHRAAPGRMVLITDAVAAAGMPEGSLRLGPLEVELEGTRAVLAADRTTLAGSVLTMARAVRHAVEHAGMPLADVLRAASTVPARVAVPSGSGAGHGGGRAGVLEPGAPADLVVLGHDLDVTATIVAGRVAFARHELFG
jgi:N-acetylglucosamine-6-phosphate deacetylase